MDKVTKKTNKKPARRDIDARREQNRIASRNYREKRKQKLALLNELLDPELEQGLEFSDQPDHAPEGPASQPQTANNNNPASLSSFFDVGGDSMPGGDSFIPDGSGGFPALGMSFGGVFPAPSYPPDALPPSSIPLDASLTSATQGGGWPDLGMGSLPSQDLVPWQTAAAAGELKSGAVGRFVESDGHGTDEYDVLRDILRGIHKLSGSQKQSLIQLLQRDRQDAEMGDPAGPKQMRSLFQLRREVENSAWRLTRGCNPPRLSPWSSSNHMGEVGLFSAFTANCYAMGMGGFSSLMDEDGHSIFSLGPETGFHSTQLAVVRPKFQHITAHLRPSDTQLTVGHHPYIDVLPFRHFRNKVLESLQGDKPLLDEDELCNDLLSGGITFWGAVENRDTMDAHVPWDSRSWEPSLWFLDKYRDFVGGWDDEMWTSSRRWHDSRGERWPIERWEHSRRGHVEDVTSSDPESALEEETWGARPLSHRDKADAPFPTP